MPFSLSAETVNGFDYDNYYQLDYVESSGSQYYDTGISATNTFSLSFDIMPLSVSVSNPLFIVNTSTNRFTYFINDSGKGIFRYGSSTDRVNYSIGQNRTIISISRDSSDTVSFSDSYNNATWSAVNTTNYTSNFILLSGFGAKSGSRGRYRIYSIAFSFGSNSGNYIPAERISDGKIGFYDTVANSFIVFSGGDLVSGPRTSVTQYTITTSVSPSGSGNVSGGGTYDSGTVVSLTATANTGYSFVSWSDGNTDNPRSVTVTADQSFTAQFQQNSTPVETFTVTTSVSPSGSGNVSGGGTYDSGTVVSLTATPNNGYIFDRWSDNVTTATRTITVTSNISLTAYFEEYVEPTVQYTVSATPSPNNGGTITGTGTFDSGSTITLTAVPSSGYQFGSWSDGVTVNPRTITVTSNLSLTAYFTENYDSSILLGVNVYLFNSQTSHYVEQYSMDLDSGGYNYTISAESISADVNSIVMLQVVLNNDYYGYLLLNGTIKRNTNTVLTLSNYKVYVNGNTANIYLQSESYLSQGTLNASITVNTANLSLKSTVQTLIVEGNSDSQQASSDLDDVSDQYFSLTGDVVTVENQLSTGFNDAMEEIPSSFDFQTGFGTSFITSARWVRNQFDELTTDNPFGTLITYSLILGVGLLILGRRIT